MDPIGFDRFTRSLTQTGSRRSALVALVAGLLAPFTPVPDAAAKRRKRRGKGGTPAYRSRRDSGTRLGVEKKKHKKKSKKPPAPVPPTVPPTGCTPNCSGGRTCGSDGCSGSCGSCTAPQTCGGGGTPGVCGSSGTCTPTSCTGGRECKTDGTCACPTAKKLCPFDPDDRCRECCIDDDCGLGSFSGFECHFDPDLGDNICRCRSGLHDCGNGVCWPCCSDEHCVRPTAEADGFYCDVEQHGCRCGGGKSPCYDGTKYICTDLTTNQNCGQCGHECNAPTNCGPKEGYNGWICLSPE